MGLLEDAIASGNFQEAAQLSPFFANMPQGGGALPPGAISAPQAPMGFTIADPAQRQQFALQQAQLMRGVAAEEQMKMQQQQQFKQLAEILKQVKDPDLEAAVLQRLGFKVQPGAAAKRKLDEQKELARFKSDIERPERLAALQLRGEEAAGRQEARTQQGQIQQQLMELRQEGAANQRMTAINRLSEAAERYRGVNPQIAEALDGMALQMLLSGGGIKVTRQGETNEPRTATSKSIAAR